MFFLGLSIFGFANFLDKYLMRYHELINSQDNLEPGKTLSIQLEIPGVPKDVQIEAARLEQECVLLFQDLKKRKRRVLSH
jgi:hypothetical protein